MSSSFKVDLAGLKNLQAKFNDPIMKKQIVDIAREKGVAALVGQAIGDNFSKNGPGWPALRVRQGQPLQKTGLLKKSVTTPGAQGNIYQIDGTKLMWGTNLPYASIHNKGGTITAKNAQMLFIPISPKGAAAGPSRDKAAQKKSGLVYGKDFVFKKSVVIPKREFLIIRQEWKTQIYEFVAHLTIKYISQTLKRGG